MGYTTDFDGVFQCSPSLSTAHKDYLVKFSKTRRMKRDAEKTETLPDELRLAVGLPVGYEGAYFVGANKYSCTGYGVTGNNTPPQGQSSLWCDWTPTEDGYGIEWNGAEKFYNCVEWLEYLIEHFLGPWGYVLNLGNL